MTNNILLVPNTIVGGVYDTNVYTVFLGGGGCCVIPKHLVEKYTEGNTPEERIYYILKNGINSDPKGQKSNKQSVKENNNKSFLNLRNYE